MRETQEFALFKTTPPGEREWMLFLSRGLLVFGTVLTVSGAVFFVAANWQEIGRYGKFAMLDAALLAAALLAWRAGIDRLTGQVALTGAAGLVGAFLALYGQTYLSGPEAWPCYLLWAALILPWVVAGRFSPLWLLWLGVLDVAVLSWGWQTFSLDQQHGFLTVVGVLNTMAWIAWETARRRGAVWLDGIWGPRLIAAATLLALLNPSLQLIYKPSSLAGGLAVGRTALATLLLLIGGALHFYRREEPHPVMLGMALAAGVTLLTTCFVRLWGLDSRRPEVLLALSVAVLVEISAATWWLRRVTGDLEVGS